MNEDDFFRAYQDANIVSHYKEEVLSRTLI